MRLRVYLAGPMGNDPDIRARHCVRAAELALALIDGGYAVYCPHLWNAVAPPEEDIPTATWLKQDLAWVCASHAVLRIPGESPGADLEVEQARIFGIPVFTDPEDLQRWANARTNAA